MVMITEETLQAVQVKQINQEFSIRTSLRLLCVRTVLENQRFFTDQYNTTDVNPFFKLPSCLLDLLRKELVKNTYYEKLASCSFFSLLINPASTTSVFYGKQLYIGRLYIDVKDFWKTIKATSNLQQLGCEEQDIPPYVIDYILRLEKLQVINIPHLLCEDQHLVLFANYFPKLRVLNVKLDGFEVSLKGAQALSRLDHFRKFTFVMWYHYYQIITRDDVQQRIKRFMVQCLQLMPWLRELGADSKDPTSSFWDYRHPLEALEEPAEIGLEVLLMTHHETPIPESCSLPNLRELFFFMPQGDMSSFGKFKALTHLCVDEAQNFQVVERMFRVVGLQLKSISLNRVEGVCLETLFSLCPNVKVLQIKGNLFNQKTLTTLPKLSEFEFVTGSFDDLNYFQNISLLTQIFLSSNHSLKKIVLRKINVSQEILDSWIHLVEDGNIFQSIEYINLAIMSVDWVLGDSSPASMQLLSKCALVCPEVKTIMCQGQKSIFDSYVERAKQKCQFDKNH